MHCLVICYNLKPALHTEHKSLFVQVWQFAVHDVHWTPSFVNVPGGHTHWLEDRVKGGRQLKQVVEEDEQVKQFELHGWQVWVAGAKKNPAEHVQTPLTGTEFDVHKVQLVGPVHCWHPVPHGRHSVPEEYVAAGHWQTPKTKSLPGTQASHFMACVTAKSKEQSWQLGSILVQLASTQPLIPSVYPAIQTHWFPCNCLCGGQVKQLVAV